jgi:hypothetical protein
MMAAMAAAAVGWTKRARRLQPGDYVEAEDAEARWCGARKDGRVG